MKKILIGIVAILIIGLILLSRPIYNTLNYRGYYMCLTKLIEIQGQFEQYEKEKKALPVSSQWCDELCEVVGFPPKKEHQKYIMNFTMNTAVIEAPQPLPDDIVLIFNSDYGWNQIGGREDVSTTLLPKKNGILVLFAGGEIRFVEAKDIDSLKWNLDDQ